MSQSARVSPRVPVGWPDLVDELDLWEEAGRVATFWWRDDDAEAPSQALERLASIAGQIPIGLAVIPAAAQSELAGWLSDRARSAPESRIDVLQHGWNHQNHSAGAKKSEFPAERSSADIAFELAAGRRRLAELFGIRAIAVLVPPWNRFDERLLPLLGHCGFSGLSRAKPRRAAQVVLGIIEANVHIDLVEWAGGRGFIGEQAALSGLITHLRARRLGSVCADEPTGILTHHLVQDRPTEAFLQRLFEVSGAHAAVLWLNPRDIFVPEAAVAA